jgi:undecaprenyl-diphosphatase
MTWLQALILGLVEGITEYLPVSSTGHLILAAGLMGLQTGEGTAVDTFTIVVQGGAILAVVGLYRARVVQMLRGLVGLDGAGFRLLLNIAIAFMPAAVIGLLLKDAIERLLFHPGPVIAALFVGGIYMMLIDRWRGGAFSLPGFRTREKDLDDLTPGDALVIGLLQCIAMWPGTSRSMMTITGGMLVGLKPRAAAEFSFLLGLPTLTAACLLAGTKDILRARETGGQNFIEQLGLFNTLLGLAVATVSAAVAVKFLVGFLNRHGLTPFGWYRIVLSVVLLALLGTGAISM